MGDAGNNLIRKITAAGVVTTLAGGGTAGGTASGNTNSTGQAATFKSPYGVAVDGTGNVYVADNSNNLIRKISAAGVVTTLAGGGSVGGTASGHKDSTGTAATFAYPTGVAVDGSGNVYVADNSNNLIRKITPAGVVTTLAGSGSYSSTNGTGTGASFNSPTGVAVDGSGNVYVAEQTNNLIRKITAAGVVTTLAGGGPVGGYTNGTGTAATFYNPSGVAVDGSGNVYVADQSNNLIRKIMQAKYSISPALPAGLKFDSSTAIISGTPTATTANTTYTVSCANASGTNSTTISFATATPNYMSVNGDQTSQVLTGTNPTAFGYNCDLIATVTPAATNGIAGSTTAKVWVEATQPAQYVKRHYQITPTTNATTASGNVTLYFTQQEFTDFNAVNTLQLPTGASDATGIANLRIEKRPGTSSDATGLPNTYTGTPITIDPADANIVWNSTANRWEVSFDVVGFSGFFVKTTTNTLSVKWLSVSGNINTQKQATISWQVAEQNVANYVIEKSNDGNNFNSIATINSKGDGTNNYSSTDATTINGIVYYRIKQTDRDGKLSYSSIIKLSANMPKSQMTIYPNPVKDVVNITGATIGSNLLLTDMSGKKLQQINITNSSFTIDLSKYSKGVYILKAYNGIMQKIIKE